MKKEDNNVFFLVIGSNSFMGSHFVSHLLSKEIKCIGISRSKELDESFLAYKWNSSKKNFFEFYQIDLNKDLEQLVKLIDSNKFTHIVNFAAQSMVVQSWQHPQDWYQTNVVSLSSLVNEIKDFKFIQKYVSITSPEVYGSTSSWIKENFNFAPSTPYAISRAAQDLHLKAFQKTFEFPVVFTRTANVYGPGQALYRLIPKTFIEALTGGKLILDGGGNSERSFIHVRDATEATWKVSLTGEVGSSYHISGLESILIKDLVELIANLCGIEVKDLVQLGPERPGKDLAYLLDSTKIREELHWTDKISLSSGLEETLDWVKGNFDFLKKYTSKYVHKK